MLTLNVIGYNPPVSNVSIRGGGRGGGRELVVLFSVRASKNSKKLARKSYYTHLRSGLV